MKRWHSSLALLFLTGVFGCSEGGTETAKKPSTQDAPAVGSVADAAVKTPDAAPATKELVAPETAKTEPTPESTASKDKMEKEGASEPVAKESTTPEPEPKPDRDPILEGLQFDGLDEQFTTLKDAYAKSPDDAAAVGQYLQIVEQLGFVHSRQGNKATASAAFMRAGEILATALEKGISVDDELKGVVFYNHACATALEGKTDVAMTLVEKALENGFDNLNQLKEDEDLASIRELPGFSEKFAAWEAKAKERHLEHARADLAKAESFPFDFELTDVKGAPIKLSDFQGKVCIVDIWGTWCPPCRAEIPSFIKLQETYGSQGFQMVGLNQERAPTPEEEVEKVVKYMEENSMNYPCALITEDVMAQVPDFEGFPTTLFIDRQGKVRLKAVGLHEYAYLEAVVSELLAEEAAAPASEAAAPAAEPAAATTPAEAAAPAAAEGAAAPPAEAAPAEATPPAEGAAGDNP